MRARVSKYDKTGQTTKKSKTKIMNAFTLGKFGLSVDMRMVFLFENDGLMKYARAVMTKMMSFFANFVHTTCDFLINI